MPIIESYPCNTYPQLLLFRFHFRTSSHCIQMADRIFLVTLCFLVMAGSLNLFHSLLILAQPPTPPCALRLQKKKKNTSVFKFILLVIFLKYFLTCFCKILLAALTQLRKNLFIV